MIDLEKASHNNSARLYWSSLLSGRIVLTSPETRSSRALFHVQDNEDPNPSCAYSADKAGSHAGSRYPDPQLDPFC